MVHKLDMYQQWCLFWKKPKASHWMCK